MWLIITVVTCVTIEFHITFLCSHHQPQVPTLPLPSCWGMWAFTTMPCWPHATHINYVPCWPHATYHATLMPPRQPHHIDVRHVLQWQDTRRGGRGGNGMRRWDEAKEGAGQRGPCQLCRRQQWHKPWRWPWRCTPRPMLTGRMMHATSIPSCVDANHVDLEEDPSHVNTQPCRRWDLSLPPPPLL